MTEVAGAAGSTGTTPAGGAAGAPPAGTAPAGAAAGSTGTPPAGTVPAGASATPPGGTAPVVDWLSGLKPETKSYVERKGFKSAEDLAFSFQNIEKLVGEREKILKIPGEGATPQETKAFHERLGKPVSEDKYELEVPAGQSDEFSKWAKTTFFDANVTTEQATALTTKWNEYQAAQTKTMQDDFALKSNQQVESLRKEWGAAHDANTQQAKNAVAKLGITEAQLDGIQKTLGYDGVMKMFQSIGAKTGEHNFVNGGPGGGGGVGPMSPAQAREAIKAKRADGDYMKKYVAGDVKVRQEMEALHKYQAAVN